MDYANVMKGQKLYLFYDKYAKNRGIPVQLIVDDLPLHL